MEKEALLEFGSKEYGFPASDVFYLDLWNGYELYYFEFPTAPRFLGSSKFALVKEDKVRMATNQESIEIFSHLKSVEDQKHES